MGEGLIYSPHPEGVAGRDQAQLASLKLQNLKLRWALPLPPALPKKHIKIGEKAGDPTKTVFLQTTCEIGPRNGSQNRKESFQVLFFHFMIFGNPLFLTFAVSQDGRAFENSSDLL